MNLSKSFRHNQLIVFIIVALLFCNATILFAPHTWYALRFPVAIGLVFVLPGMAWLPALNWMHTHNAIERLSLIIGLSSVLSALTLFIGLWITVPFTETPVIVGLNLLIGGGIMAMIFNQQQSGSPIEWPSRTTMLILVAIFAVALFTRTTRLGYAEFHEDELENMRLIVRAYKGEAYAAFLDSKGPIHWLLPASLWYLNGWLNETIARTPFVITSLLLIPMIYALGRRMSHVIYNQDAVGLIAAGFIALNGFFVAYARHVENQSLIVFWGTLAVWFAYRYYQERRNSFLYYTAITLAVGLIAHPDVLLYLPIFVYVLALSYWSSRLDDTQRASISYSALISAGLLFGGLVALFYIPYLTDPQIGLVYQYFAGDRIGESLLYNRVPNLFDQDKLYSTRYHAPILVLLLTWLLARNFNHLGRRGWAMLLTLALAIISTVALPNLWIIGNVNLAFGPYALLTLAVLWLPSTSFEIKTLYLWLTAPLGALLFLAQDAADHIQIAYPAWALLAGFALHDILDLLSGNTAIASPTVRRGLQRVLIITLGSMAGVIVFYQYITFCSTVTAYWQVKHVSESNPNSIYNWLYGSIARPRKLFSNPRLGGWKAVGYLRETGQIQGDFRSINESFAVPIWYNFQTPRSCYDDPDNSWVRRSHRGWPDEEEALIEQKYALTRIILVDQEPKLHLYEKNGQTTTPEVIDSEDYRHQFDLLATPKRYAGGESIEQVTSLNFGDKLLLTGYNMPIQTASANSTVPVTVFWQALAPMQTRYRAFMHLVDDEGNRWAQHDDDPACRLLTNEMRPEQRSSRQFRLTIDSNTPSGEYQVIFGIYHPDDFQRLEIWDNLNSQPKGNSLNLGTVQVE
ncbi:glycosyltransferase family 39 protein [Anaerolineales bacterium HSG24]|nr:glycosyltransferase family 39 protein [Anaerolineales bacterium HSG24]